ncbi:MAG: DUF3253 domain-containing protein [Kiloniellales bacterium]
MTKRQPDRGETMDGSERDDPVAQAILALLAERGPGKSIGPSEAAQAFAVPRAKPGDPPDLWRRHLNAVKQQALHLARQGRLVILRKGKPADPNAPIKGVIRLALPQKSDG